MCGIAGSYDPQDFSLGRLIGDAKWVRKAERLCVSCCYDDNLHTQSLDLFKQAF